jgi:predicted phosphodiesterase
MNRRFFLKTGGLATAAIAAAGAEAFAADVQQTPQQQIPVSPFPALAMRTRPYLQNLTPEKVTIFWLTNSPLNHSWVEYGENGLTDRKAVAYTRGLIQAGTTIQQITLDGLKPSTSYSYRACSQTIYASSNDATFGETVKSEIYTFTTPGAEDTSVSVLIFNDIHNNHPMFKRMIPLADRPNFDFVFLNGDILEYTENEKTIVEHIIDPLTDIFASERPFATVRGNHETRHAFARHYFDYFRLGDENLGYYTFRRGPVFFLALDTGEDKNDNHEEYYGLAAFDRYREEEARWLERQLASRAAQYAPWRVVFMHCAPYHGGNSHDADEMQRLFHPLFEKYKVDVVFSGHTHQWGVHPACEQHKYPIIVGGGRDLTTTVIRLQADMKELKTEIVGYDGGVLGNFELKR